ncbi:DUF998 domain-containing protein [Microbacterium murale]|uniref:DUF998 domain-containing protein n=1 Tax=Microbacterium murale TaxID=1081040 RepID=A0ABQ1RW36_9MICO|nr:DUF998 domain-containing protein [Microbacterium murale]GGD81656.1 hypothetical protein GCM10007269_25510 [Microbacterium murale]
MTDNEMQTSLQSQESLSLGLAVVAFIMAALVALPVFQLQRVPISGDGSIGQYSAIAGAVVATLAFIAGRYVVRTRGTRIGFLDVIDIGALCLAHAVIALLSWTLLAVILERGFLGAEVYPVSTLLLGGAAAAVTAYVSFVSATRMSLSLLAIVLAAFLIQGVLASTLTASDPNWWKENLSALGMTDDLSAFAFNLTLIVAGVLVTALARAATRGIPNPYPHGTVRIRTCLIIVGIFLGLVGVFPVDRFFVIHNTVASGMAVTFAVMVVMLHRWMPTMPRAFVLVGWLFVGVIVVLAVFFATGFYTLTAVELVAGILVFTWIILFIRNAAALEMDAAT